MHEAYIFYIANSSVNHADVQSLYTLGLDRTFGLVHF